MNLFPENILLNGARTSVNRLPDDLPNVLELREFLKEWYSSKSYIEVQTSGSTGIPKIIRLEKEFVAASALRTITFFQLKEGDRVLHCLPLKYIAGKLMVVRALIGKLDLYMAEPSSDFSFLENEKFRFAAMVPNQVAKILNKETSPGELINNVEIMLLGGSSVPFSLEQRLKEVETNCYSGYAMTETATHIALRKINASGAGDYYKCLDGINVSFSENNTLQIFMPGLKEQPLQTTDLAELKDEKTFKILGRSDNVIISGGIKFSPELIEKKLEPYIDLPFVVSSQPHSSLGEQLVLVMEGKESEENRKDFIEICSRHLEKYEQPKRILFVDKLPLTSNNKIDRNRVKTNLGF